MNQTAEKVLTDIRKYSILKVTFFFEKFQTGISCLLKKNGGGLKADLEHFQNKLFNASLPGLWT